jgi:hypothetical protein
MTQISQLTEENLAGVVIEIKNVGITEEVLNQVFQAFPTAIVV